MTEQTSNRARSQPCPERYSPHVPARSRPRSECKATERLGRKRRRRAQRGARSGAAKSRAVQEQTAAFGTYFLLFAIAN